MLKLIALLCLLSFPTYAGNPGVITTGVVTPGHIATFLNGWTIQDTGTGTLGTSLTSPLIIGGSGVGSNLSLQSTAGVGSTDYINFLVGNNGATEAMRIIHSGNVGIGTVTPTQKLSIIGNASATGALFSGGVNQTTGALIQAGLVAGTTMTGTVSTTGGSATVTGVGTAFTRELNPGDIITINGEAQTVYQIASVNSLTTTNTWVGTNSGVAYASNASGSRFLINRNGSITASGGSFSIVDTQADGVTSGTGITATISAISTTSPISGQLIGMNITSQVTGNNTQNWTNSQGNIGFKTAVKVQSPATGTFTQMVGGYYNFQNNSATATVVRAFGGVVDQGSGVGTTINLTGLAIAQQTQGTNNTYLYLGALASVPTGNYAIYDNSSTQSYLSGNLGIGTTTPQATLDVRGPVKFNGYTIGTLPSGVIGMMAYVTDAVACTFLAALTGGGTTVCPVFYNGTAWVGG